MKAIVYERYGLPEVLELREVPTPVPGDEEVLVEVHASSLNAADLDLLKGVFLVRLGGLFRPRYEILGADVAGRVEAVGSKVTRFRPGDEVWADLYDRGLGALAEYVSVPEEDLRPKPAGSTFAEAAAVPQAGVVALQGLCGRRRVRSGDVVLINGAGGGVGTFAVQLAKHFGAHVTAVDSAEKLDVLRALGADHVIDYAEEDYTRSGQKYDLILDAVARRPIFDYRRALRPAGAFVLVGGSLASIVQAVFLGPLLSSTGSGKPGILMWRPNRREDLESLSELLEAGAVAPVIDGCYPLDEVAEAFRVLAAGHHRGKIVITMRPDTPTDP